MAIVADPSEIYRYLGIDDALVGPEVDLLGELQDEAEQRVKDYLGYNVERQTGLVEWYEGTFVPLNRILDVVGGVAYRSTPQSGRASVIRLRERPVEAVTEVREDRDAYAGQGTDPFPAGSVLTAGTHYMVAFEKASESQRGFIVRIGSSWPSERGSVQVTYTAGWADASIPKSIKNAVKKEVAADWVRHSRMKVGVGDGVVAGVSESGVGSATFQDNRGGSGLLRENERQLRKWRSMRA